MQALAAGGLALINSMGQMAGFLSPYLVGFVKDATGSTDAALYLLAAVIVGGSVLAWHDPRHASRLTPSVLLRRGVLRASAQAIGSARFALQPLEPQATRL